MLCWHVAGHTAFPDRWSSGIATAELITDDWDGTVPLDAIATLLSTVARHLALASDLASASASLPPPSCGELLRELSVVARADVHPQGVCDDRRGG